MAAKTIERIPQVPVGGANCLACTRINLRGGDNTCPVRELRDGSSPGGGLPLRERGTIACPSFVMVTGARAKHRIGIETGPKRNGVAEQGELF